MEKFVSGILAIILVILFICLGPALLIWSVNALFGTSIAFTFWNWLAGFVLIMMFGRKG